jgi:hypothetical protein
MLQKLLLATIPATAIFLAKDLLLEVIIIHQASRMFDARKDVLLRQLKAFGLIVSMLTGGKSKRRFLKKAKLWFKHISFRWILEMRSILLRTSSATEPSLDDSWDHLRRRYVEGEDRDEDFDQDDKTFVAQMRDRMRDECRKGYRMLNKKFF